MAAQLSLLQPAEAVPTWAHEGAPCAKCGGGMHMVVASEPCTCSAAICECLAEGYAKCGDCGDLQHVWPREMIRPWQASPDAA